MAKQKSQQNPELSMKGDDQKQFYQIDLNKFQEQYGQFIETPLLKLSLMDNPMLSLVTNYKNEEAIFQLKDKKEMHSMTDLILHQSISDIKKRLVRQNIFITKLGIQMSTKINSSQYKDIHSCIDKLIMTQVLLPGGTPLMTEKWGDFNINPLRGLLSAQMDGVLKTDTSYDSNIPQWYIRKWVQMHNKLNGK